MAPPKISNAARGTARGAGLNDLVKFTIRASPLPQVILGFLLENLGTLKSLQQEYKSRDAGIIHDTVDPEDEDTNISGDIARKPLVTPAQFWAALQEKCKEVGGEWQNITDRIWAFGPSRAGGCVLVDSRKSSTPHSSVFPF
jgi:ribosome assembly protein 1